jgi:hypothetical protein
MGTFNRSLKNKFIEELITDIANNESSYYIGFGQQNPWDDDFNPPAVDTTIKSSFYDVHKNLLFGKKVTESDTAYMLRRVNWTANTVYDYYSHIDPNLYEKDFYVITSDNSVYKCLFNNYGARSTIEPSEKISIGDFDTADGYKWKFMYRIKAANYNKFSTYDYIPVYDDINVRTEAENGAIHTIVVTTSGSGYPHSSGQIEDAVTDQCFKISNATSSGVAGEYNLSTFYVGGSVDEGVGIVVNYVVNTSGRFVFTDRTVDAYSGNLYSSYSIAPQIVISGDGQDAFAIGVANTLTGGISSIEVIDRGLNYTYSTVSIIANTLFGSGAAAYSIISPKDGHGTDAFSELGSDVLGISVATKPSDNLYSWATYRQVSLIYNPTSSENNNLYTTAIFKQALEMSLTNVFGIIPQGDTITGLVSRATATVLYMDTDKIYVTDVVGQFSVNDIISGSFSGVTCSISSINIPDLLPYSGEIFYYRNFQPFTRTDLFSEQVQLYFKY